MKTAYLTILIFAAGMMMACAQTNATTNSVDAILALATTNALPPVTNAPVMPATRGPTTITAAGPAECDLNNHWITYCDDVCVSNADVKLTCQWVKAIFPQTWGRPTNILAETNVVIEYVAQNGEKTRATGEQAVDIYQVENGVTNDTVTLTGNALHKPRIEQVRGYFTADEFIWDRSKGTFFTKGAFEGVGNPNFTPPTLKNTQGGTNAPGGPTTGAVSPGATHSP